MPDIGTVDRASIAPMHQAAPPKTTVLAQRGLLIAVVAIAAIGGVLVTSPAAVSNAVAQSGPDLTRLLRAMAGIKAMAAIGVVGVLYWRLASPVSRARLAGYALAACAMAAGPGLIWGMVHVGLGALLLHGGLLVGVVVLWRDPAMAVRLSAEIARRRARLGAVGRPAA
jgi:hypothetical protein